MAWSRLKILGVAVGGLIALVFLIAYTLATLAVMAAIICVYTIWYYNRKDKMYKHRTGEF